MADQGSAVLGAGFRGEDFDGRLSEPRTGGEQGAIGREGQCGDLFVKRGNALHFDACFRIQQMDATGVVADG